LIGSHSKTDDAVNSIGGTGHLSSAAVGFGLLGLCFAAKLNRMAPATAAGLLQETLTAFDNHWWPRCENARLCPHWLQESRSNPATLENWGNAELSTIDSALVRKSGDRTHDRSPEEEAGPPREAVRGRRRAGAAAAPAPSPAQAGGI
jgi:hypothetical protein